MIGRTTLRTALLFFHLDGSFLLAEFFLRRSVSWSRSSDPSLEAPSARYHLCEFNMFTYATKCKETERKLAHTCK